MLTFDSLASLIISSAQFLFLHCLTVKNPSSALCSFREVGVFVTEIFLFYKIEITKKHVTIIFVFQDKRRYINK